MTNKAEKVCKTCGAEKKEMKDYTDEELVEMTGTHTHSWLGYEYKPLGENMRLTKLLCTECGERKEI